MNLKPIYLRLLPALALASLLTACGERKFTVEGTVSGADGKTIVLQRNDPAGWLPVDSASISNGEFSFSAPAPEYPELYRLMLNGKYVYLPVDSIDNLSLTASLKNFDTDFKLAGTPQAEKLTAFEHEAVRVERYANADSTEAFRKRVFNQYLREAKGNILSFYILSRPMGEGWLIDYTSPLYSAVATSFHTYRPDDPHTAQLEARARQGVAERRKAAGATTRMEAKSSGVIPISLPGLDGKEKSLESLLGKGKPVVVAFVAMTDKETPALNRTLRSLYEAGRCDVYEVCLDADQFAWRQASRSLPWTVVLDPEGSRSQVALRYNVGSLPAFFIYNAAGDLVQSTGSASAINSLL